jgi:hypothetical protein
VQEVFLTVTAKAADFQPGTTFLAWAKSIARLKILEARRKEKGLFLGAEILESLDVACPQNWGSAGGKQGLGALGGMTGRKFCDWQTAGSADAVMGMVDALERATSCVAFRAPPPESSPQGLKPGDVGLRERLWGHAAPRCPESVQGAPQSGGVVRGRPNPQIDVAGGPRNSVTGDRIRTDNEKINAFCGQGFQHLGEVAIHPTVFR